MKDGKFSVFFARFPYGGMECYESSNWMIETVCKCKADSRIYDISHREYNDTPITMTRNLSIQEAKRSGADYLVMLDSDMAPDVDRTTLFWDSSWDFIVKQRSSGPCMVAAPYCGPPPHENVYIFKWATLATDAFNKGLSVEQFTREEVVGRRGFEEVAALPTGLILIDMRVFGPLPGRDKDNKPCQVLMPHPYFDYEWEDLERTKKASTEDVFFTRNASLLHIPCYVNWSCWAGHIKRKVVTKPWLLTSKDVRQEYADAIANSNRFHTYKMEVSQNGPLPEAIPQNLQYLEESWFSKPHSNGKIDPRPESPVTIG